MARIYLSENKLKDNYKSLSCALPNVKLYYACKTNSDLNVLRILNECGSFFDVATNGEIDILESIGISLNCLNSIHTHPIKSIKSIDYAISKGVRTFVIDNRYEALKLIDKECDVLIRISFPNPEVKVDLSSKFGVHPDKFLDLYQFCISLGITVRGISFHVGSNCPNAKMHVRAIQQCIPYMNSLNLKTLDIGGGFPCFDNGNTNSNIYEFCSPIESVLRGVDFEVIAEPGRYIVADAIELYAEVIGKAERDGAQVLYIDTGVYGMLSGKIYDHQKHQLFPITVNTDTCNTTIFGHTCDSIDWIEKNIQFPIMDIGDKIRIPNLGAYSIGHSSRFNGFPLPEIELV